MPEFKLITNRFGNTVIGLTQGVRGQKIKIPQKNTLLSPKESELFDVVVKEMKM